LLGTAKLRYNPDGTSYRQLPGIFPETPFLPLFFNHIFHQMKTVHFILRQKGDALLSISPDASVLEALRKMMDKNVSALLVLRGRQLLGIFTERDYARKIILQGRSSAVTPVGAVMSSRLITVCRETPVATCMEIMTRERIRHLPVLQEGRLEGIISIGDLVKHVIEEQQHTIMQLETYISS